MDPLVLTLLVIIVLAGGFIGMLADHLGRRIGKKKLSFRSMRPKHVARLGTFIAGTLVSLITIMLVYSTSSGIREWITQGRAAIGRAKTLTAQNANLEADIRAKTTNISELNKEASNAHVRLDAASAKLLAIRAELGLANQRLAESRQRVAEGRIALAKNQDLLRRNIAQLQARQAQLAAVSAKWEAKSRQYAELKKSYGAVYTQRDQANDEVAKDRRLIGDLGSQRDSLQSAIDKLTRQRETLQESLTLTRNELHDDKEQLITLKGQLDTLRTDLRAEEQAAYRYYALAANVRTEPLTYARGQEVVRKRVGPHLSERQAHDAITSLLKDASAAAQARGAAIPRDSDYCVFLPDKRDPSSNTSINSQQIKDAIASELEVSDQDVVLIATAEANGFKGEPLPLEIMAYHNPIAYRRGDVLATLTVPRRLSLSAVWTRFNAFMNGPVHNRALADRMIPAAGKEDSLLNLEPTKTIDLLERLAHSDRTLQLEVVAKTETRVADPLQLDFVIK